MKSHFRTARWMVLLGCCALSKAEGTASKAASQYSVVNKISLPGDGGWDCMAIDDSANQAFVSHATKVQVVDLKTGKLLGAVPDIRGARGIALARDLKKGFVSNQKDSSVTVFDIHTLAILGKIPVAGRSPEAVLYDSFSHRIFVFSGAGVNTTVIDARADTVLAIIPLDGQPGFAVTDGHGTVYVSVEDRDEVDVLDSKSLKLADNFSIVPGHQPTGIARDPVNGRLFIACGNKKLVVADALEKRVVALLPTGEHADGVEFDPGQRQAFCANGEGTLTVVQEEGDDFKVVYTVITQKGARTLAVNAKTHHLYLPSAEFSPAPPPTVEKPKPLPTIKPNSFVLLDITPTD